MPSSNRFRDPDQRVADFDQFQVRLPHGMRDEIRAAAKDAGRSMNAEIIARLSGLDTVGLRDRFAGQALGGILACNSRIMEEADAGPRRECLARSAFALADAMLAAREAR